MNTVTLRLFASTCRRNDYYISRIRQAADEVGLSYTLEHISDEDLIEEAGLTMPCLFSYCPGCHQVCKQALFFDPSVRCTPALEVNGAFVFYGEPATDEALRTYFLTLLRDAAAAPASAIEKSTISS